ncbi:unnamed protein product [Cylindrotheca closterium]|uniref:Uncharacterized protein n=1 Tax=Cylindrotheca closterium TaxID=2856 RepID=A0AAD2FF46_9STRA|nr:unnamed protein product [Cylindrotheca closterium]
MISAYRTSIFSVVSTSGRRAYSGTVRSLKSTANRSTLETSGAKVATESAASKSTSSSFVKKHPFKFQLGVATVKTSAADLVAQVVAEQKSFDEIDWRRNGLFVVFGFTYLGCFQYWLMVTKYRHWFPTMDRFAKLSFAAKLKDTAGIMDAMKMVLFDVTIHLPILYFPTYYTVKELVGGKSWNPADWVKDGVTKYTNNAKEDLTAMIQLWGPSDCIQFVLPVHIRLPFRHVVSFFWTTYVSFTRGAMEDDGEKKDD